jgi:hypothetical protein
LPKIINSKPFEERTKKKNKIKIRKKKTSAKSIVLKKKEKYCDAFSSKYKGNFPSIKWNEEKKSQRTGRSTKKIKQKEATKNTI